jgi:hypothetical protein
MSVAVARSDAANDRFCAGFRMPAMIDGATTRWPASDLIRRACKASVTGDGLTIAQVTREDLVDQHVSCLDPNADLCNEADQIARGPFAFSSLLLSWRVIAFGNVVKMGPYKSLGVNVGHVYTDVAATQRASRRPRFQSKRFCHQ